MLAVITILIMMDRVGGEQMTDEQIKGALIDLKRIANALDAIERHLDERLGKAPVSSKSPPSSGKGRGK